MNETKFDHYNKIILIFFVILIILFSCQNKEKQYNTNTAKPIELKAAIQLNWIGHWKNEGLKEVLVHEIAREFEFENPDIKVNLKFPQEIFGDSLGAKNSEMKFYADMLVSQKSEWDIIRIDDQAEMIASYLNDKEFVSKYLVDLKQYPEIEKNHVKGIIDREQFKARWNNVLPGAALDGADGLLWCNQDLAKMIGIEVKQFGMTFDDFEGYLKALFEYNKTNKTDFIGIFEVDGFSLIDMIPRQLINSEMGNFEDIVKYKLDEKRWAAFEKTIFALEKLARYKPLPSNRQYTWDKDKSFPLKGTCLFYPQASWMFNIWLELDSLVAQKIIPVQLPEFQPSQTYLGEYRIVWAIPKNSPHINEAVRLMKFIAKAQTADKWIRYAKSSTGIKNSIVSTTMGFDAYENFDYTINKKFVGNKIQFVTSPEGFLGNENKSITLNFRGLLNGKITATEFIKSVKSQLN